MHSVHDAGTKIEGLPGVSRDFYKRQIVRNPPPMPPPDFTVLPQFCAPFGLTNGAFCFMILYVVIYRFGGS